MYYNLFFGRVSSTIFVFIVFHFYRFLYTHESLWEVNLIFFHFILLYYTPTRREGAILQSPCPSVHTFVKDVSAATGRNDFIFDTWLWHSDLYRVFPFQAYRTSTSCLPRDLEFFMFAVMKTFVTDISASTGRNDFIFDIWLWHGDLYRASPFQVYCTSTSCLLCDLEFFMFAVMKIFIIYISASTGRNDFIFDIYGFGMVTCTVSPLSRFTAHLLPVYSAT